MLATVRRGSFAAPTQEENIEFVLIRMKKSDCKVAFADHALEHTLSFQRRVRSIKQDFLRRGVATPLGITQEICFLLPRAGRLCMHHTEKRRASACKSHAPARIERRVPGRTGTCAHNDLRTMSFGRRRVER